MVSFETNFANNAAQVGEHVRIGAAGKNNLASQYTQISEHVRTVVAFKTNIGQPESQSLEHIGVETAGESSMGCASNCLELICAASAQRRCERRPSEFVIERTSDEFIEAANSRHEMSAQGNFLCDERSSAGGR